MTLVHSVEKRTAADFSVMVVGDKGVADLLVYREEKQSLANWNEAVWCFTKQRMGGAKAVHFTEQSGLADLNVCFVNDRNMSGWMKHHRLKGRLAGRR